MLTYADVCWRMQQQRKRAAKIKNELKSARVIDLVRFPIMSQVPRMLTYAAFLLERYYVC